MPGAATPDHHPLERMLAISDVIENRRHASVYARVIDLEPATVEDIAQDLDSSETTIYEDVNRLREMGLLERITDSQPYRYRAREIELTVHADDDTYEVAPTFIVTLARSETNENIQLFLDRHGTAGLATAVDYAREYVRGAMTARVLAREQEIPVLEAETILQELREVILDVEPDLEGAPDIEALDAAVTEPE